MYGVIRTAYGDDFKRIQTRIVAGFKRSNKVGKSVRNVSGLVQNIDNQYAAVIKLYCYYFFW